MNDLDKILNFLLNHSNTKRRVFKPNTKSIKDELFPDYNIDQIRSLLNQIQNSKPDILKFKRGKPDDLIEITGLTESFLNQGGFTKIEKDNLVSEKRNSEKENLEFEKSKIDLRLKKWQLRTFWWIFGFAVLGSGLGIYNFINGLETDKNSIQEKTNEKPTTELSDFSIIRDFEKNKSTFTADTLEVNDYSTDGGELIAYTSSESEYMVLDFWIYGETGRLNYTYWTDSDLNFKKVKKLDFEYSKPYVEIDFEIDSTLYYLSYFNSKNKLYDINKKEILNSELIDSTKTELEKFFKDVSSGVEIVKEKTVANNVYN